MERQVFATGTPTGSGTAPSGEQSESSWLTTSSRGSTWPTPTPPSTWRSTHPRRCRRRPCATRELPRRTPRAGPRTGDYCAGSNHVLPTAGCAHLGLSVRSSSMHVVESHDAAALAEVADHVTTLAEAETCPVTRGCRPGPDP